MICLRFPRVSFAIGMVALPLLTALPTRATEPVKSAVAWEETFARRQQWWSFQPIRNPVPPNVQDGGWSGHPLDRFVLARLEEKGLRPAPPADPRTWLRRVHYIITGLPPTRADLHAFLGDRAPDARAKVVDRLLASPHFGERWARHWMDLMRYAESRGHEGDYAIANVWQYRDYLVRALNADVPYDRFLLEHIAGDLLPQPRQDPATTANESVLATGWAFLGEEIHSPVDIRQDECERIDNKVDVFSKSFLGLTVSCARCHDHKFDPISSKDYYALTGFFLSSSYRQARFESMEQNHGVALELDAWRARYRPQFGAAFADAARPGLGQIADYLIAARAGLQDASVTPSNRLATARPDGLDPDRLARWIAALKSAAGDETDPLHSFARLPPLAADPSIDIPKTETGNSPPISGTPGVRIIADFSDPTAQPWQSDGEAFGSRPLQPGDWLFTTDPQNPVAGLMTYGAAHRDPFWRKLATTPGNENDSGQLGATSRAGQMLRTPTVTLHGGRLHYLIRGQARVYAAVDSHIMVEGPLHGRLLQRFDTGAQRRPTWVTHDLTPYAGHRLHIEFSPMGDADLDVLQVVESELKPADPVPALTLPKHAPSPSGLAQAIQWAASEACRHLAGDSIAGSPRTSQCALWADWLLRNRALVIGQETAEWTRISQEFVAGCERLAGQARWESRTAVAMFDGTGVDENVLVRGKPSQPGAIAPRSLPSAFSAATPLRMTASSGRHELGLQLVDPANPLVARVIVNRVWHHVFGRGLVATVDNFGALGERPSHPELLDHLAWKFGHEDGWSLKRLVRQLVLSETFAQGSRPGDDRTEELDPNNVLLHRMPVRRLEAEVIRDAVLAVSGRLNPTLGGPPVPVHLTEFVVGRGRPDKGGPLDGDGRRSLYTAVRRNFLPTLMLTFDTPTPFSTVGRRNVTNVPAQALALMNDPLFHEQALVWATRLLHETPGAGVPERLVWLYETAYGRPPTAEEASACAETLAELKPLHGDGDGEAAVWGDLCHALLSANDFIYVR